MKTSAVLLVDDNASQRRIIEFWLREERYDVTAAASGEEALRLAGERQFDAVISDIKMPGMTGIDLLARLRESIPDVHVILTTGFGTVSDAVAAMKLGGYRAAITPLSAG